MSRLLDTLHAASDPHGKAEADAADKDQRRTNQQRALAHYAPIAQQVLSETLNRVCDSLENLARIHYASTKSSGATWLSNWQEADGASFEAWKHAASLTHRYTETNKTL